ncbi:MAG TPA: formimidoylglutamase [Luteibaculaceae bacterium]|nr:formimidoylglutamase [Luteibaculaceae bacterium]
MDFSEFCRPFDPSVFPNLMPLRGTLGEKVTQVNDLAELLLGGFSLAVIGVPEDRNCAHNTGCAQAPDLVRRHLYSLFPDTTQPRIADLGNFIPGETPEQTYFGLQELLECLLKNQILPILIGGSNDLSFVQYKAYKSLEQMITFTSIDSGFDFGYLGAPFSSDSYTERIITDDPTHLYTYCNIGYQAYYTDPEIVAMMDKLHFDVHRLAEVRGNIDHVEPVLRNTDCLAIDISAVKASDAPGNRNASPNGLYAEEICKLMKYAGLSDKISSIGFYEYNPTVDTHEVTAKLLAQMIWCFVEAHAHRVGDYPIGDTSGYQRFIVETGETTDPFIFYKSPKSGRWWIEAPRTGVYAHQNHRQRLVPCNYEDYVSASNNKIPQTWWAYLMKTH